jgi:hypothetical protein
VADSEAFDWVCEQLERSTSLDRLEARGTVRLALKASGLEAQSVTPEQMQVVVEKVLPAELDSRGIADGHELCGRLRSGLGQIEAGPAPGETPDQIFQRLGG